MNRGEIWWVQLDPGRIGDEMNKTRPAVIINHTEFGHLAIRTVVPLITWKERHDSAPWLVPVEPTPTSGLDRKDSADALQVTCVSVKRLLRRIGAVSAQELVDIVAAVAMVVGHELPLEES